MPANLIADAKAEVIAASRLWLRARRALLQSENGPSPDLQAHMLLCESGLEDAVNVYVAALACDRAEPVSQAEAA